MALADPNDAVHQIRLATSAVPPPPFVRPGHSPLWTRGAGRSLMVPRLCLGAAATARFCLSTCGTACCPSGGAPDRAVQPACRATSLRCGRRRARRLSRGGSTPPAYAATDGRTRPATPSAPLSGPKAHVPGQRRSPPARAKSYRQAARRNARGRTPPPPRPRQGPRLHQARNPPARPLTQPGRCSPAAS